KMPLPRRKPGHRRRAEQPNSPKTAKTSGPAPADRTTARGRMTTRSRLQKYHIDRNLSSNKCYFHTRLGSWRRTGLASQRARHYVSTLLMTRTMANVVTINRPDVVALIEEAAKHLTGGNKTEAVALGMRRL